MIKRGGSIKKGLTELVAFRFWYQLAEPSPGNEPISCGLSTSPQPYLPPQTGSPDWALPGPSHPQDGEVMSQGVCKK